MRLNALVVLGSWCAVSVAVTVAGCWARAEWRDWQERYAERRYAREVAALREMHDRLARPEPTGELRRRLSRQAMRRSVPFDAEVDG